MATQLISPEHQVSDAIEATSELSKRQRFSHRLRGRLLRLISGGDSPAVISAQTPALSPEPKPLKVAANTQTFIQKDSARMPTVGESLVQNPKLPGETRTDYVKRMTGAQPPQAPDALEGPLYVPASEPTPIGDSVYIPKHRAEGLPASVPSQEPVELHVYDNLRAESPPNLHVVKQ